MPRSLADASARRKGAIAAVCLVLAVGSVAAAQEQTCALLPGSELVDECPACGRPPTNRAIQGIFRLRLQAEDPPSATYEVTDVAFATDSSPSPEYQVTGDGIYRVGGEVAVVQSLDLDARVQHGAGTTEAHFADTGSAVEAGWPAIALTAVQTNGTEWEVFQLRLVAAPIEEPCSAHRADQNGDWRIQLSPELTRLIQFYNSGGYHCQTGTEDGYAPGAPGADLADTACGPHQADQNGDWRIQLSPELTRLIQFYNSGGYHCQTGTEDGYAPGPPPGKLRPGGREGP
jgi:hypothetical protein